MSKINEYGEIIRDNADEIQTEEQALMAEYYLLAYEIHHRSRPTNNPEKIARYQELKNILKIDEKAQANAFDKARQKALQNIAGKTNKTPSIQELLAKNKKQNV